MNRDASARQKILGRLTQVLPTGVNYKEFAKGKVDKPEQTKRYRFSENFQENAMARCVSDF